MSEKNKKRRWADSRKAAVAARRIIIAADKTHLRAKEIYSKLPPDIRAEIEPEKLNRVLKRSQRAGLKQGKNGWSVRPVWLERSNEPWQRKKSTSELARVRLAVERACGSAMLMLEAACPNGLTIDELLAAVSDPTVDRRKFARGLWNRSKSEPRLFRIAAGRYVWKQQ